MLIARYASAPGAPPTKPQNTGATTASVFREAYRLEPCYLAARRTSGELAGILPLVQFRTLLGGRELISLPYLDAAGILAGDPEAAEREIGLFFSADEVVAYDRTLDRWLISDDDE